MIVRSLALVAILLVSAATTAQPLQVRVDGAVARPGPQSLPTGSRLADAVIAAKATDAAYPTGAMLLRRPAQQAQLRLKAGLMHDLGVLEAGGDADVAALARELADWLDRLTVTGRVRTDLSPRRLESTPAANLPLVDGDRVHYPMRPTSVRIVGAVDRACITTHVPLQDAHAYLASCPVHAAGSREWLFVIQPDGAIQRIGTALWNRSEPQALAPGAVLYVPLAERATRALHGDFNAELAGFLATQPMTSEEAPR